MKEIRVKLGPNGQLIMLAPRGRGLSDVETPLPWSQEGEILRRVLMAQETLKTSSIGSAAAPIAYSMEDPKKWLKSLEQIENVYVDAMDDRWAVLVTYKKKKGQHTGGHSASWFDTEKEAQEHARKFGWTGNPEEGETKDANSGS